MLEVPLDALYVWIGLAIVGSAAVGVVVSLPAAPPPDASGAATTVDGVAGSPHDAIGKHPLPNADAARVGRDTLSLRGPGGTAHAELAYGPVTQATTDRSLNAVLLGTPATQVFEAPSEFERAIEKARTVDSEWHTVDELVVRHVSWKGIDVVLVG